MTVTAVTFYDVIVWVHICAVVVGFGGTFAYGIIIATARRSHPRSLPGVLAGIGANDRILVSGGAAVILVTGIYLAADSDAFSEFFVAWGFVAIIALGALGGMWFAPNERRALEAAERDVERAGDGDVTWGPEFEKANANLARMGPVAGIIIVLTIYVMTTKPFA